MHVGLADFSTPDPAKAFSEKKKLSRNNEIARMFRLGSPLAMAIAQPKGARPMKSSAMILAAGLISASAFQASAEVRFTAGVQPDRRPEGAPRITEVFHPRDWYVRALTGVTQPYPHSLFFLDAQGDWYSPFILPGMLGRYDIRGWHVATQPKP